MTLNDRERFILHSMSVMVVDLIVKRFKNEKDLFSDTEPMTESHMNKCMEDVRIGRCRKMSIDEMAELYEEMKEEMLLGSEVHKDNI